VAPWKVWPRNFTRGFSRGFLPQRCKLNYEQTTGQLHVSREENNIGSQQSSDEPPPPPPPPPPSPAQQGMGQGYSPWASRLPDQARVVCDGVRGATLGAAAGFGAAAAAGYAVGVTNIAAKIAQQAPMATSAVACVAAGTILVRRHQARPPPPPPNMRRGPRVGPDTKTLEDAPRRAADAIARCLALCRDDKDEERNGNRLVLSFDLQLKAREVFAKFWADDFYARVLEEKCHNEGLETSAWTLVAHSSKQRAVTTLHPLTGSVRIPGVPLHVPTAKEQIMVSQPAAGVALAIFEQSRFENIRYAKAISVETTWLFCDAGQVNVTAARVYYRCVFDDAILHVPGWLKAFCDQRTREELRATYGRWVHAATGEAEAPLTRPPLEDTCWGGPARKPEACWCFGEAPVPVVRGE